MELMMSLVIGALFTVGTYLLLSRSLLRIVLGTALITHGVHLLLMTMAGLKTGAAPLLGEEAAAYTDPLPQALILTSIVISFGVTAFFFVLAYRSYQELGTDDMELLKGETMNNAVVLPLLVPFVTGVLLIFFASPRVQRIVCAIGSLVSVFVSAALVHTVKTDGIQTLYMGGWLPPFGIIFVADMLAALLALTTSVIMAACMFYAFRSTGEAVQRHYFFAFAQFLSVGVTGSFLTGDIFNLFVCFEVMLISSYALITLGGEKKQLRESIKYLLVNIVSSALFVASIAYLYAALGTLNMAQLALRVAEAGQGGILNVVAVLLLVVFALKAGLFLFFWLPGSYAAPQPVVAALFAGLLTKVGVYAIVRMFTLIFTQDPGFTQPILLWMAIATMVLGAIGAVAYRDVPRILIYNIVVSVGLVSFGVAAGTAEALQGIVFYLMHDMAAKALIFLLGGWLIMAAGTANSSQMGGWIERQPALGWMFLITGLAIAGVPPLSGFVGKLLIVQGGFQGRFVFRDGDLVSHKPARIAVSRSTIYDGVLGGFEAEAALEAHGAQAGAAASGARAGLWAPCAALLAVLVLLGVGAEWVSMYALPAGDVLANPSLYIDAVLKE